MKERENEKTPESSGMRLLRKGQRGILYALFSRLGLFILLLLVQIVLLLSAFLWFERFVPHLLGGSAAIAVVMVVYLLNTRIDATAKLTWLVVIMLLPVFGTLLFWYTQGEIGHRTLKKRIEQLITQSSGMLCQNGEVLSQLDGESHGAATLARYINRNSCHPVYGDTGVTYFPDGESMWDEMLRRLESAESYIFMEYFILEEGLMWGKVLEILARKAAGGVDVRIMYDGMCEFTLLPPDYPRRLRKLGIRCKMFAPVSPFVSTHYNYRDHRKILVIDGRVAFTGGINMADEYINHKKRFGHWKDTAVMLCGEAARSFTLMFLQMWGIDERETEFGYFLREHGAEDGPLPLETAVGPAADTVRAGDAAGYVIPYGDCPLDSDKLGERVYMDILNRATQYVHIMTPYLILDGEMENALKFAAERGVDVCLILPGIPDRKTAYSLAKTHYRSLLDSGVRIYEYTPGFIHAKVFVADGREAVVGTVNLDYRSLYHHFECAVWMYGVPCIREIAADFDGTLAECRRVTPDTVWKGFWRLKPLGYLLKVIAPLM